MATESVAANKLDDEKGLDERADRDIEIQDRIDDLSFKAIGILQVMRRIDSDDVLPADAVSGSAWAVEGMINEIKALAAQKGA
jgi:hypothetical protein